MWGWMVQFLYPVTLLALQMKCYLVEKRAVVLVPFLVETLPWIALLM
ncbi:Uncharacterised protein [Yersinia enterocolitica]|nr:Uncharacterised protein [Yersinia enterocolitica]CRX56047.1 Uncharacterised protein [Yersinia enterocolitica]